MCRAEPLKGEGEMAEWLDTTSARVLRFARADVPLLDRVLIAWRGDTETFALSGRLASRESAA